MFAAMTRLLLHIGDHKTGTSSIQQAFSNSPPDGWLYPVAGRADGAGHQNLAWQVGVDKRFDPAKGSLLDAAQEVARAAPDAVLISSEAFEFKKPALAVPMIDAAFRKVASEMTCLVWLRPHASRLLASFCERVRRGVGPFDRDAFLDKMLSGGGFGYSKRIESWRAASAPRGWEVSIRPYHAPTLKDQDVIADFAEAVGLSEPLKTRDARINRSPSAPALRMMQICCAAFERRKGSRGARHRAAQISRAAMEAFGGDFPKPAWTPAEARRIREACIRDAERMDAMIGGNLFTAELDLAVSSASPDRRPLEPETEIALAAAADFAAGGQRLPLVAAAAPRKAA